MRGASWKEFETNIQAYIQIWYVFHQYQTSRYQLIRDQRSKPLWEDGASCIMTSTSVQMMDSDTPSQARIVFDVILSLMWICGGFESEDTLQRANLSVKQAVLRVENWWKTLKVAIMQEITAAEITMLNVDAGSDYNITTMDDMYVDRCDSKSGRL